MAAAEDTLGWTGHTLEGKYVVEDVVGEGGFASVYRGHHKGFDEKVAIKCLRIPKKLVGEDREKFLASFLAEGKLLHQLSKSHAGIVQALDVGVATSPSGAWTPYIVLEWLEGDTLEHELRARRKQGQAGRSLAEAIRLLEPAARALAAAHAEGVAHRDVKPANLFCTTRGGKRTIKVVDFGIAKVLSDSSDLMRAYEATGVSIRAFTPRYGAPEQFERRFGATGPWTDVFALALIVVEVVTGTSAMEGDTAQLFVQASNPERRPTLRAHGVNEGGDEVERVLARALAVDTKERYADAGAFWDALVEATAKADTVLSTRAPEGVGLASDATKRDAPLARAARPRTATEVLEGKDEAPRKRGMEMFAALAFASVLLGAVYLFNMKDPGTSLASAGAPDAAAIPPHVPPGPSESAALLVDAEAPRVTSVRGFLVYENPAFHFRVDYPDELMPNLDPDSGVSEGMIFVNAVRSVELRVWGGPREGYDFDAAYAEASRSDLDKHWVKKADKSRWWYQVVAEEEGSGLFYERTILTDDRYATLRFRFHEDRAHWEPLVDHVLESLAFRAETPLESMKHEDAAAHAGTPPR